MVRLHSHISGIAHFREGLHAGSVPGPLSSYSTVVPETVAVTFFLRRIACTGFRMEARFIACSNAIGQNHAYINKIESGGGYPKMEKFFFICDYLGITPQEFFETGIPDPIKSKKVYQAISALTSEQLDAVLNMIKAMKK